MLDVSFISESVQHTLVEDVREGDVTGSLIPSGKVVDAHIVSREGGVICGIPWVNEVFNQVDASVELKWHVSEGDAVSPGDVLVDIHGLARSIVTAERTALNWLQTLSGTSTLVAEYVRSLEGTSTQLLDTRKTIPGLRYAQKYAAKIGGAKNHRMGLFDAFLIKENHIESCGSISAAVKQARMNHPGLFVEVEVENFEQLGEAIHAKVDRIMLDNFELSDIWRAVKINAGKVELEVSGNVDLKSLSSIAKTGVDYVSVGAITKNLHALDFSLRILSTLGH